VKEPMARRSLCTLPGMILGAIVRASMRFGGAPFERSYKSATEPAGSARGIGWRVVS
jgi:hypothetical protein